MPTPDEERKPSPESRPGLRADARRNRGLLLEAAREVFAEKGAAAPLDDVARRAGVGNATMYRHFPTRRELLVAVYAGEVEALRESGEALLEVEAPGGALFAWLREFVSHVASKRELALAIPDERGGRSELFDRWHGEMRSTVSGLLARAQESGAVRADVGASDLLALANGVALAGADDEQIERLLRVVRRGTEARSSAEIRGEAVTG